MKYIFLFVNPTSGGNKASTFTEFGVNEILFHKPHKCHFFIYNILEGEKGKKPGFINLSSLTHNPKKFDSKVLSHASKSKSFNDKNNFSPENVNSLKKMGCLSKRKNLQNDNEAINDKNVNLDKQSEHDYEKNKELLNETKWNELNCENKYNKKENELTTKKFKEIKDICIYVLVAGGDGTLNWVLKEAESYNINNNNFAISVIPFGTGNDFAKAFGWKKIEDQTFKSKIEKHDYWIIELDLKDDGYFNKINSKTKKKETLTENNENVKKLKLFMSNYFSIGIDSRIGRGFERHRRKNALCNKVVYAIEGFKKVSFKKNIPVNLIIDKMVKGENYDSVIFTTNTNDTYPLLKKAMSIICINIPSYSSGNDIWNYTHKIGLSMPKNLTKEEKKDYEVLKKSQQEVGDGILEFVIYQSGIDLGLEFTLKGRAYRVHQGIGPWKIFFKEQKYNVYFQVDGEYYLMSSPNYISIYHYKKINVLKNINNLQN